MVLNVTACGACLLAGLWLLFYAERVQQRITRYHDRLKRTNRASIRFIRITSYNYELPLRLLGGVLIVGFFVILLLSAWHLEGRI